MKFTAFVLLALSVAFLRPGSGFAQQAPQQPVQQLAPAPTVPVPAPPAMVVPPAHHSRSLQKAAPNGAPAPAAASKPESGNPDVVVGGLPGAKSDADEKQP